MILYCLSPLHDANIDCGQSVAISFAFLPTHSCAVKSMPHLFFKHLSTSFWQNLVRSSDNSSLIAALSPGTFSSHSSIIGQIPAAISILFKQVELFAESESYDTEHPSSRQFLICALHVKRIFLSTYFAASAKSIFDSSLQSAKTSFFDAVH